MTAVGYSSLALTILKCPLSSFECFCFKRALIVSYYVFHESVFILGAFLIPGKSHLVIVQSLFNVLLNSVC